MEDLPKEKLNRHKSKIIATLVIIAVFAAGFYFGKTRESILVVNEKGEPAQAGKVHLDRSKIKDYLARDVDFDLFLQVWDIIKKDYVDPNVAPAKLLYGAME